MLNCYAGNDRNHNMILMIDNISNFIQQCIYLLWFDRDNNDTRLFYSLFIVISNLDILFFIGVQ